MAAVTPLERVAVPRRDDERVHVQTVTVTFEYPVAFTRGVFGTDDTTLLRALSRREPDREHRAFVVAERAVADATPRLLDDVARWSKRQQGRVRLASAPLVVPGGEPAKNAPDLPAQLVQAFDAAGLDRHAFVIAIGGGALQDVVGFAAAIAHRGLRVVRLPTTVLSQADGGVGVKNGVNAFGKKNLVGTFAPPFAVIDDFEFLRTLPRRDAIAGMAEALKVALVRDADFFAWMDVEASALAALDERRVAHLVERCALLHLQHIATGGDPFELGSARPLDFGHWAAHKLESLTEHALRHGEAVAIGIALDVLYAASAGVLAPAAVEPILGLMDRLGLPTFHAALGFERGGRRLILDGLREFREHLGGELTITLPDAIGHGVEVHAVDERLVLEAIDRLAVRPRGAR